MRERMTGLPGTVYGMMENIRMAQGEVYRCQCVHRGTPGQIAINPRMQRIV
jgi:hypothetical protein